MRYSELEPEKSVSRYESAIDKITKVLYSKPDPSKWAGPGMTSRIIRDGGWFGGQPEKLPDLPLEYTSLDETLLSNLLKCHKKHGFFPPTAYHLNHDVNAEYAQSEKNGGVLEFPVLYIDAKYDAIGSSTTPPKMVEPQKETTKDVTSETIEAAHWVQLEKPEEVNAALEKWLGDKS